MKPATTRSKRLLELISSYSFNLYYMKGKDRILNDFLLQQDNDDSNPNKIIPISFDMFNVLENNLDGFDKNNSLNDSKYLVKMHSQAKTSGTKLPEVHGVEKSLKPKLKTRKTTCHYHTGGKSERPWMGQGRVRSKRRKPDPISQTINQSSDVTQEIPGRIKIVTGKTNSIHRTNSVSDRLINNNPFMPDVPLNQDLLLRTPKQQIIKQNIQEINPKINFDFEENSSFQEGIMLETFQRLDKSFFQNPKALGDLIKQRKLGS